MREIKSPSARWPGVVVMADYLTTPQAAAFTAACTAAEAKLKDGDTLTAGRIGYDLALRQAFLPAVCEIVTEWRLDNFPAARITPETFPASPHASAAKLLSAVVAEISAMLTEADEIPKG